MTLESIIVRKFDVFDLETFFNQFENPPLLLKFKLLLRAAEIVGTEALHLRFSNDPKKYENILNMLNFLKSFLKPDDYKVVIIKLLREYKARIRMSCNVKPCWGLVIKELQTFPMKYPLARGVLNHRYEYRAGDGSDEVWFLSLFVLSPDFLEYEILFQNLEAISLVDFRFDYFETYRNWIMKQWNLHLRLNIM